MKPHIGSLKCIFFIIYHYAKLYFLFEDPLGQPEGAYHFIRNQMGNLSEPKLEREEGFKGVRYFSLFEAFLKGEKYCYCPEIQNHPLQFCPV